MVVFCQALMEYWLLPKSLYISLNRIENLKICDNILMVGGFLKQSKFLNVRDPIYNVLIIVFVPLKGLGSSEKVSTIPTEMI